MKNQKTKFLSAALILAVGFSACSKNEDIIPDYDARINIENGVTVDLSDKSSVDNVTGKITRQGQVYQLRDFQITDGIPVEQKDFLGNPILDEDGNPVKAETSLEIFHFDFKENDAATESNYLVSFGATTSKANLLVNTDKGYGLSYIDKAFENVNANDTFTEAEDNKLDLRTAYTPDVEAWLEYTGGPKHQVLPIEGRTYILTKDGNPFFKFRVNSVYSGEKPEKEEAPGNYFYYSIDYQEFK